MQHKLVVSDEHPVIQFGLMQFFDGTEFQVIASTACAESTRAACQEQTPDVLLLDLRLGTANKFAVLEALAKEHCALPVIMMSDDDNPIYVAQAAAWGARDFISKAATRRVFRRSLRAVVEGREPAESSRLAAMKQTLANQTKVKGLESLTARETQILAHIALGLRNQEISRSLGITIVTVKAHVKNLMRKLRVDHRTKAAIIALEKGLTGSN